MPTLSFPLAADGVFGPVLETVLDAVIVINMDGTIVGWNAVAHATFGWTGEEAVGQSLERLIVPPIHRQAHRTGLFRVAGGGEAHVLGKRIEISAVCKDGREIPVELAISRTRIDDETYYFGFLRDISARREAEARLERQALETQMLFEVSTMAAEADSYERALETTLRAICRVSGWPIGHAFIVPELEHRLVSAGIWIEDAPGRSDTIRTATENTAFFRGIGLPGRIWQDGEPIWVADTDAEANFPRKGTGFRGAFGFPLHTNGRTVAILEFFSDTPTPPDPELLLTIRTLGDQLGRVIERKRTEERQRLLLDELNHRVKNTLSVVQGIAHQTFRSAASMDQAHAILTGRLNAVAKAHELLAADRWSKASMVEIIESAIGGCGAPRERFDITGRDFNVSPVTAVNVALAIHELCTNAFKYGALSNDAGRVAISWTATGGAAPSFSFEWRESGGPSVVPPIRKGFGSNLLQRGLGGDLGGEVKLEFAPEGLTFRFMATLPPHLTEPGLYHTVD